MGKVESSSADLRPLYMFDQLVIGPHNQFAVNACQEVLKTPGETYNPLFLYGPPGVGKTHLMQAVAHQMLQQNPGFKIRYISGERFMSEVLTAISEDHILELRRNYSQLDLLILDDVQYLIESKISQEELFHVFNNMHQANHQVIIASDRPPNQLTTLNNNIRTRLEWGLSTDVKVPDEATRLLILQRKQQQMQGLNMDNDMLLYVAQALHTNVRELEGFLKRIHAYITLSHQALSLTLVKAVVKEILPEGAPTPVINAAKAQASVAETPVSSMQVNGKNGHDTGASTPEPISKPASAPLPPPPAPQPPTPKPEPPVFEAFSNESLTFPSVTPPDSILNSPMMTEPAPQKPEPMPMSPARPPIQAPSNLAFDVFLEGIKQEAKNAAASHAAPPPAPSPYFTLDMSPANDKPVADPPPVASTPVPPDLQVIVPPKTPVTNSEPPIETILPEPPVEPTASEPPPIAIEELDDLVAGHKDISAVFFYPEGALDSLETVHRKFQDVIKKHKLKFRLKRVHSEEYPYKGKINYSSFVDVCKNNKVPVAIVIGPPPAGGGATQQDFYDLLTVTLDVQGVSLQLVNWTEINKDYRYLNLALDIALVRSR